MLDDQMSVENAIDTENPFLCKPILDFKREDSASNISDDSLFNHKSPSKCLKISDWLEKTDKEWLDSVLQPTTIGNVKHGRSNILDFTSILKKPFLKDYSKKSEFPNNVVRLTSATTPTVRMDNTAHNKNKPLSDINDNKSNKSADCVYKKTFWDRLFRRKRKNVNETNFSKSLNSPRLKKARSVFAQNQTINTNSTLYFVYYYCSEPTPFRTFVNQRVSRFTLKDAKCLIPGGKKKNSRFFFKNIVNCQGIDQIIFDELYNDDAECPIFEKEIVCKVFID
uniref:Axin-1 (Trinotate prediction) n=1 Tax=Henneguya salminicola TaxID=69463 RepID=A0A6G3MGQ7_HENSL